MQQPIVYVIQEPGPNRDFSSAQRYGTLSFVLQRGDRPSYLPGPVYAKLRKALKDFTDQDYVIWAGGDPMASILAGMVLRDLPLREVNFLRWERERDSNGKKTGCGYYVPGVLKL